MPYTSSLWQVWKNVFPLESLYLHGILSDITKPKNSSSSLKTQAHVVESGLLRMEFYGLNIWIKFQLLSPSSWYYQYLWMIKVPFIFLKHK